MAEAPLPFVTRLWFAWVCFFRVLFDGAFAARAYLVREAMPALPPAQKAAPASAPALAEKAAPEVEAAPPQAKSTAKPQQSPSAQSSKSTPVQPAPSDAPSVTAALQLLALFQREGRLLDFLEQDVATYSDADVGAAARLVHEGCRKALRQHAKIGVVRSEEEGAQVTIAEGYDAHEVKLVGNVSGKPPYKGVLRHKGWRLRELSVPTPTKDHDATVIAPAEVEL